MKLSVKLFSILVFYLLCKTGIFWPCTVAANQSYSLHVTVTHRHTFTQLLKCVYLLD